MLEQHTLFRESIKVLSKPRECSVEGHFWVVGLDGGRVQEMICTWPLSECQGEMDGREQPFQNCRKYFTEMSIGICTLSCAKRDKDQTLDHGCGTVQMKTS